MQKTAGNSKKLKQMKGRGVFGNADTTLQSEEEKQKQERYG